METIDRIQEGLAALPFLTNESLAAKSLAFIQQLARWNRSFNLTAIRQADDMVGQHLMDSLAIAPYIKGQDIIDVGSGAGLPGIPLAILYPDKNFTLLDSNGKKTRFMTQTIIDLQLTNVEIVQARVEAYQEHQFDQVLCRAFAALPEIAAKVEHLLKHDGNVLALKGKLNEDTSLREDAPLQVKRVIPVKVPLVEGQRCLVELVQKRVSS